MKEGIRKREGKQKGLESRSNRAIRITRDKERKKKRDRQREGERKRERDSE